MAREGFSRNPKLRLSPARAKEMTEKFFGSSKKVASGAAKGALTAEGMIPTIALSIAEDAYNRSGGPGAMMDEARGKSPVRLPKPSRRQRA